MKHLITYNKLLEFNRKDKKLLSSGISNHFTIAFEFEIETNDDSILISKYNESYNTKLFINLRNKLDEEKIYYDIDFIEKIINMVDFKNLKESFNKLKKVSNNEYIILLLIDIIKNLSLTYDKDIKSESNNLFYAISKIKKHLPNFYLKYHNDLKFEFDLTLKRGIEFSPKTYIIGIENGLKMIDDFYKDLNDQSYWYMSDKTSIHINIGLNRKVEKWNYVKGLIMMVETTKRNIPYVYKDIEYRKLSAYCQTLLDKIKIDKKFNSIDDVEKHIENRLGNLLKKLGSKTFGVNLDKIINNNYVEFRFIGGNVSKDLVIDKILYFCYITYLMITDYKDQDYHKKLYKYVTSR